MKREILERGQCVVCGGMVARVGAGEAKALDRVAAGGPSTPADAFGGGSGVMYQRGGHGPGVTRVTFTRNRIAVCIT